MKFRICASLLIVILSPALAWADLLEGTIVRATRGPVAIEKLTSQDSLPNPLNENISIVPIEIRLLNSRELTEVQTSTGRLQLSADQAILVRPGRFKLAGALTTADALINSGGTQDTVLSVMQRSGRFNFYRLVVDGTAVFTANSYILRQEAE